MKEELALDAELIKGRGGVFDVRLDGELVYSKKESRRFPESGEVERILRPRLGPE